VKDAHDRYANQELAYLLQRIEEFEGLSILTTNMPGNMDEAFRRRLAATVYFPMPDEAARRRLWAGAWPAGAPLAADVDHDLLAARLRIPGGVIVHAALAAAYLAAGEGTPISLRHVLHAVRRELDALGAPMPALAAPAAGEGR
jgi:SpoVK/Ycf46/Vps4 family AAA+-type ATPase